MRLPDFIIIGAMKCATSTLHEQLARQPGVFMSTPKEPNFFSDDDVWSKGMEWYAGLFRAAPDGALCGESSTHYTKLPTHPHTVSRMTAHLDPRCRFIYIMRHPIDRLISQYIHEWTQRVITVPINEALDTNTELIDYSRYAMQLIPYLEAFGTERVLPVFFERLSRSPQSELERICRFIGFNGQPRWDETLEEQNVSSQRMRRSAWRDALTDLPGAAWVRRTFVPQAWRDRIKSLWMMKQRPELSESSIKRLAAIFDEDLSVLSPWLGTELTCEKFKAVATNTIPVWSDGARLVAR